MKYNYKTKWLSDMKFESEISGHKVLMDVGAGFGGNNEGPTPKPLLISALTGCTGMDVVSILKKMHVEFDSFEIKVETEMTEDHPKIYNKIHLIYKFSGENLNEDKLNRAVALSQEKYCGVSAMLSKSSELTYEVKAINKN